MNQHLLIFGSVMVVAWALGTSLLVYFWPHLVNNIYKRAILNQGFGDGPVPINTLYTEPQALFADPLHTARLGFELGDYWRESRHAPDGRLARPQHRAASAACARLLRALLQRAIH